MIVYVETSAAAKLVVDEPQSEKLVTYLDSLIAEDFLLVSSMLLETELRRMATRIKLDQTVVSELLQGVNLLQPDRALFVEAGLLPGTHLRSLDALHIATAVRAGADSIVSYDARQSEIAGMVGLRVVAPA